ncbi:unnamed protein product, partial [Amoebophrya sp. A120]|eukprot:GSA120T00010713001.1
MTPRRPGRLAAASRRPRRGRKPAPGDAHGRPARAGSRNDHPATCFRTGPPRTEHKETGQRYANASQCLAVGFGPAARSLSVCGGLPKGVGRARRAGFVSVRLGDAQAAPVGRRACSANVAATGCECLPGASHLTIFRRRGAGCRGAPSPPVRTQRLGACLGRRLSVARAPFG